MCSESPRTTNALGCVPGLAAAQRIPTPVHRQECRRRAASLVAYALIMPLRAGGLASDWVAVACLGAAKRELLRARRLSASTPGAKATRWVTFESSGAGGRRSARLGAHRRGRAGDVLGSCSERESKGPPSPGALRPWYYSGTTSALATHCQRNTSRTKASRPGRTSLWETFGRATARAGRPTGVEPASLRGQRRMLPLHHGRPASGLSARIGHPRPLLPGCTQATPAPTPGQHLATNCECRLRVAASLGRRP